MTCGLVSRWSGSDIMLATNPQGSGWLPCQRSKSQRLTAMSFSTTLQSGKQLEAIGAGESVMGPGTLNATSKKWRQLRGAPNSEMHNKDWERYITSPEEVDARAASAAGADHIQNLDAIEGMYNTSHFRQS